MLVRDRMSKAPITIRTDADYKSALRIMQQHAVHHVPVLDANDHLAGILAERDLLLAATLYLQSSAEVGDVMHRNVVTVTPDTRIEQAATLMLNHKIGGLPVVDGDNKVVGIITETDIFSAFVEKLSTSEIAPPPHR